MKIRKRVIVFNGKSHHTTLPEFEKSKNPILLKVIEDVPCAMAGTADVRNIVSMSLNNDELPAETSRFRYRIQIINGLAKVIIKNAS